jgi:hypothetical protein
MNTQLTDINKQLSNCVIPKLLSGRLKKDCELLLDKGGTINIKMILGTKISLLNYLDKKDSI